MLRIVVFRIVTYNIGLSYRLGLNHSILFVVLVCFGCTVCTVSYEILWWRRQRRRYRGTVCVLVDSIYRTIDVPYLNA